MKPFSLEDWKKGKPVITRNGIEVTELHCFETAKDYKIYAAIRGKIFHFYKNGKHLTDREFPFDLFHPEPESEPLPKRGDIVWVRDSYDEEWACRHYVGKYKYGYNATSFNPFNEVFNHCWKQMTTKNPYLK